MNLIQHGYKMYKKTALNVFLYSTDFNANDLQRQTKSSSTVALNVKYRSPSRELLNCNLGHKFGHSCESFIPALCDWGENGELK
jgi:hypothetical protein